MAITMATILQWKIEATELRDAIDYALRSIKACGGDRYCTGIHAGQLYRGCEAAALFLDYATADGILYSADETGRCNTKARLTDALKIARETLAETDAILKAQGTLAQRRMLLADAMADDTHEMALAA